MPVPEPLSRIAARVGHVRVSVQDLEAARGFEDTGEIVLSAARAADADAAVAALERIRARGVALFPMTRTA